MRSPIDVGGQYPFITVYTSPSLVVNLCYFGWVNQHTIEKTFHKTTQSAVVSTMYPMRKHFKSRLPGFNICRRSEEVATDTIFSDTPAIDSGVTMAQLGVKKISGH